MATPPSRLDDLVTLAAKAPRVGAAIAHPCDPGSIQAAVEAARLGFITPILGEMRTMPGLGATPGFMTVDIDQDGEVVGLT